MLQSLIHAWSKRKLIIILVIFFLALGIPVIILITHAYSQIKWEAFHRHQSMSSELVKRIDTNLLNIISIEEARSFTDYSFLNIAGGPSASFLQRSPLSLQTDPSTLPGLIGYFQLDDKGSFSTPLLPVDLRQSGKYGITKAELNNRTRIQESIYTILNKNKLLQVRLRSQSNEQLAAPAASGLAVPIPGKLKTVNKQDSAKRQMPAIMEEAQRQNLKPQVAFDRLYDEKSDNISAQKVLPRSLGRLEDLNLASRYPQRSQPAALQKSEFKKAKRALRKEQNILPEQKHSSSEAEMLEKDDAQLKTDISIFESEIDAIEISILDSGHMVLYRKVWRNGQRYIQGLLISTTNFLSETVKSEFNRTALSKMSNLLVAYQGNILSAYSSSGSYRYSSRSNQLNGELLYRSKLSQPFNYFDLVFNISRLPTTSESTILTTTTSALFIVFIAGFLLLYKLGLSQININHQQQDFVSAVSHELKTPLTSIRMYSELLREGWTTEEKKMQYYDYIHDESERLSRLITNVLQLSRMSHNSLNINFRQLSVSELIDNIQSKISKQVEHADFKLNTHCNNDIKQQHINVDIDFFSQIIINLVDNALKFSKHHEPRIIDISCKIYKGNSALFAIRDYGPGIPSDQIKKIFRLFYRTENELTRETVGTGIGLALVKQLTLGMHGQIDIINKQPGTEFRLVFPLSSHIQVPAT